jgi:hypothetical protein
VTLHDSLTRAGIGLRRVHLLRQALPPLVIGTLAFAVAAWLAGFGFGFAAISVLVGWTVFLAAVLLAAWRGLRASQEVAPARIASEIESRGGVRRGSITTLLDPLAAGTSTELHALATASQAEWVSRHGSEVLEPVVASHKRGVTTASVGLLVAAMLLALARPLGGAPAMLWQPWQAFQALAEPVRLAADSDVVDRGSSVTLRIIALGQQRATLRQRAPGEAWRDTVLDLDAEGRAEFRTAPLENTLVARVSAGGRTSDEVQVSIRVPAFLGSFTMTAHYPAYLGLESEVLGIGGDTLLIPAGTRLSVAGRATAGLASARFISESDSLALTVDNAAFAGEFVPVRGGVWSLAARTADNGVLDGLPEPIVIQVIPDSAPSVTIPVPGVDTIAPPPMRFPLMIAIEDDHGVVSAALEVRHARTGQIRRIELQFGPQGSDRALINEQLPLDAFELGPGDTLYYAALARDNHPAGQVGRSREFSVRVPTVQEQRERQAEATESTRAGLDSLRAAARNAQREAEDQARSRQRGEGTGNQADQEPMTAEAARRAEQVAEAQREVAERLEEMQQAVAELERAAENAGVGDSALAQQLSEIRELLESAMTPELREAMERLQQSLQQLDREGTRQAMQDLARQQNRMREAIDRARELFERAALEAQLASLAEQASELAAEQQQVADAMVENPDSAAARQEELAATADSLAAALEQSAQQVPAEQTEAALERSAESVREAAQQMRSAAQSARQGERNKARQQASAAGEMLEPIEQQIREGREAMQEAMQQEVLDALDRLLAETTRVLTRQYQVADALNRGALAGPIRAEESMIEEATAKLFQQVIAVSGKNALISPMIGVALAGARDGIRGVIDATSSANPSIGLAADRAADAVDYLSLAAYALLRSKNNVENSESGSGLAEAMAQMQSMAGQQSQLSNEGQQMMQQGGGELSDLMRMAAQQRAIAQQLERMRAQGQMPGAGEMAAEARQISRTLEQGRLDTETVARQERLFRRMLDAGRTLEGEERDENKERESESARTTERARPGALDPALLRSNQFQPPSWEELQRLGPDDRRRVLDYFRRLTESSP